MTQLEFDFSSLAKLLGALAAIMALLQACFWWAVKWLLDRHSHSLEKRLAAIETADENRWDAIKALERELLQLRAELPEKYVRREDWIRLSAIIDSKLDGLRATLETMKEKQHGPRESQA